MRRSWVSKPTPNPRFNPILAGPNKNLSHYEFLQCIDSCYPQICVFIINGNDSTQHCRNFYEATCPLPRAMYPRNHWTEKCSLIVDNILYPTKILKSLGKTPENWWTCYRSHPLDFRCQPSDQMNVYPFRQATLRWSFAPIIPKL